MKEMLSHITKQLDKLDEKLDTVDRTLVKQEGNLREHMRRTEILEAQHEELRSEMHNELEPVKTHIAQVKGITKFIVVSVPLLAAIAGAIYKYLL